MDRVHHIDPADALETSGDLAYNCKSTASIVSLMVHPMGRLGTWPSILHEYVRLGLCFPSDICSTDEHDSCLHFARKFGTCLSSETSFLNFWVYFVLSTYRVQ